MALITLPWSMFAIRCARFRIRFADELQRIAETYKSDFEIAKQNEDSVQKQLDQAVSQSQVTNEAQVALRELESNAQTYRALYDNFLQRYMESVQQQSFPITEARVITAATRPAGQKRSQDPLVLGLATMVGLAFGIAAAAWREFADRVFRTAKQVETASSDRLYCLGSGSGERRARTGAMSPTPGRQTQTCSRARTRNSDRARQRLKSSDAGQQTIAPVPGVYSAIVEAPFSAFAEAIRSIKVAIDQSPTVTGGRIIGFTSSVPNEGKSSIAAAVARLAAQTGARTLLVDCDLRNPSLSRLLSPKAAAGLLGSDERTIDAGEGDLVGSSHQYEILAGDHESALGPFQRSSCVGTRREVFRGLTHSYDYIIVDFAPLMPIVDVRASTNLVDAFIYVVEWGKTRTDFAGQALQLRQRRP